MIIALFLFSLSIQKICLPTQCQPTSDKGYCYLISNSSKTYYINVTDPFLQCNGDYYCKQDIGNCTKLAANGEWCVSYRDCLSHYCVNHICKTNQGKKNEPCDGDIPFYENQCLKGYTCNAKQCVTALKIGSNNCNSNGYDLCDILKGMCFNSKCTKWFSLSSGVDAKYIAMLCQSYAVDENGHCISRSSLPSLVVGKPVKCNTNLDCKYTKDIKTDDVCVCPKDNRNGEQYCVYGGGEDDMILAVNALKSYSRSGDRNHDAVYLKLLMMADERERLELIDPAQCSYANYIKSTEYSSQPMFIIVVVLVSIALIPILLLLISLVFCNK